MASEQGTQTSLPIPASELQLAVDGSCPYYVDMSVMPRA